MVSNVSLLHPYTEIRAKTDEIARLRKTHAAEMEKVRSEVEKVRSVAREQARRATEEHAAELRRKDAALVESR